jgi:hypothetical protein
MGKLKFILIAAALAALSACSGGGSDNSLVGVPGTGPGGTPAATVGTLTLLTSSPQIPSDGGANATVSALVRDSNNNVMANVSVVFNASSGSLVVTQPSVTDASGVLTAELSTAGDRTNRTITINGIAGGSVQGSIAVDVVGTTIQINGPTSIPLGPTADFTVVVSDANGAGVSGATVTLTSSAGNAVTPAGTTTDTSGELAFTLLGTSGGADTISAAALGAIDTHAVIVSSDSFVFNAPDPTLPVTEFSLGAEDNVQITWAQGAGLPISFATSRGSFTNCAGAAIPNNTLTASGTGTAALCVTSTNAGPAVLTATNNAGTSIQANVEFVATTPTNLEIQVAPATVPADGQSQITSVVRDANGNLVKNQTVNFVLSDVTGGSLSVAQAITNSQGRAQTVYNASSTTSALDGVRIDATVLNFPLVTNFETLTVAQRELFIAIGTGNEIFEPNTAQYRKEWIVQVSDAQGNGVSGANVTFSVLSERYWDGFRFFPLGGTTWATSAIPPAGCLDEDTLTGNPINNRNGVLDPGEDNNLNGEIEAGNIAAAVDQASGSSTLVTDQNGFGIIDVYWPQEYAYYLEVTLEARASVQGSESAESTTFVLDGSASDFGDEGVAPPGVVSPFGTDGVCSTAPPPDGP